MLAGGRRESDSTRATRLQPTQQQRHSIILYFLLYYEGKKQRLFPDILNFDVLGMVIVIMFGGYGEDVARVERWPIFKWPFCRPMIFLLAMIIRPATGLNHRQLMSHGQWATLIVVVVSQPWPTFQWRNLSMSRNPPSPLSMSRRRHRITNRRSQQQQQQQNREKENTDEQAASGWYGNSCKSTESISNSASGGRSSITGNVMRRVACKAKEKRKAFRFVHPFANHSKRLRHDQKNNYTGLGVPLNARVMYDNKGSKERKIAEQTESIPQWSIHVQDTVYIWRCRCKDHLRFLFYLRIHIFCINEFSPKLRPYKVKRKIHRRRWKATWDDPARKFTS